MNATEGNKKRRMKYIEEAGKEKRWEIGYTENRRQGVNSPRRTRIESEIFSRCKQVVKRKIKRSRKGNRRKDQPRSPVPQM